MNAACLPLWLAAVALATGPVLAQGSSALGQKALEQPTAAQSAPAQSAPLRSGVPAPATSAAQGNTREILLQLGKRTISLRENGKVIGSWPVAIGDPSTPTPLGRFTLQNKVVNPKYQSTKSGKINATVGPNGPLGDRWMGFQQSGPNQYGIHGTPSAWAWTVTSRAAVTNGCVRMLHEHVRKLFDLVDVGTPVIVQR
jgi:lipoprotein-anchoring transpeptidase ErfK/SrfK